MDEISAAEYWARVEELDDGRTLGGYPTAAWEAALAAAFDAEDAEIQAALAAGFEGARRTLSDVERAAVSELLVGVWDESGAEFSSDQTKRDWVFAMLSGLAKSWAGDEALTWALAAWYVDIGGMDGPTPHD